MSWVGRAVNPAPFTGSKRQRKKNINSHSWGDEFSYIVRPNIELTTRLCLKCGTKKNGVLSEWPCGANGSVPLLSDRDYMSAWSAEQEKRKSESLFRKKR